MVGVFMGFDVYHVKRYYRNLEEVGQNGGIREESRTSRHQVIMENRPSVLDVSRPVILLQTGNTNLGVIVASGALSHLPSSPTEESLDRPSTRQTETRSGYVKRGHKVWCRTTRNIYIVRNHLLD